MSATSSNPPDRSGPGPARGTPRTDVEQIDLRDLEQGSFPTGGSGEYRVCITSEAFAAIQRHAASDTTVELCGVLAGRLLKDGDGPFLLVENAIAGQATRRTGSQVTFTHETWEQIHSEMETRYPDKRIVGWYHTHPGFGIFLSEMDQFIQDNFFNLPHSVAFVWDPLNQRRGLFIWRDGRSVRLRRYWLAGEVCYDLEPDASVVEVKTEPAAGRAEAAEPGPRREPAPAEAAAGEGWGAERWGRIPLSLILAGVLLLAATLWLGTLLGRLTSSGGREQARLVENLIRAGLFRDGLDQELNQVAQRLSNAHSTLEALAPGSGEAAPASPSGARLDEVREAVRDAHRDLARIAKVYTEADRLARRLGAVPALADDVALLKRDNLNLRVALATVLALEADRLDGGSRALSPEQQAAYAEQLRQVTIQLVPELRAEIRRRADEAKD